MLQLLYPIGFIVCLSGLILWFYHQDNPLRSRTMSQAFLGGFFVYLFSLAFSNGDLSLKLWALFRDLIVIGVVSQCFNLLKSNKVAFLGALATFYLIFYFFGFTQLANTFSAPRSDLSVQGTTGTGHPEDIHEELLVDIDEGHKFAELQDIIKRYGLTYERAFFPKDVDRTNLDDYFVVDVADQNLHLLGQIKQDLMASGIVDFVEENDRVQLAPYQTYTPERKGRTFGLNDPEVIKLWGFEAMQIDRLYDILGSKKVSPKRKALIAILDTGVDAQHEDLRDNFISINSKSDTDKAGHGTHCAGIAGAVSNNKIGVASFSHNNDFINITSIKVLSDFGGGTQQGIIKGIIEATDKGADVLSLSLGGPSSRSRKKAYEDAVKYANEAGAIVIVAAGNSNSNAKNYSPANTPGVITVSAVDTLINKASFSNYVSDVKMGIAAPGVQIYSTIPGSQYTAYNGTSMATPYVAGLVGLLKSLSPDLTTKDAYQLLHTTGQPTGATKMTGRLIQPADAVSQLMQEE